MVCHASESPHDRDDTAAAVTAHLEAAGRIVADVSVGGVRNGWVSAHNALRRGRGRAARSGSIHELPGRRQRDRTGNPRRLEPDTHRPRHERRRHRQRRRINRRGHRPMDRRRQRTHHRHPARRPPRNPLTPAGASGPALPSGVYSTGVRRRVRRAGGAADGGSAATSRPPR